MAHTFTNHLYHIVFSTQERRGYLTRTVRDELFPYMSGTARKKGGSALCSGGVDNHLHILANVQPNVTVSAFVGAVKANSSRWLSREFADLDLFGWQTGFASFTVSESNWRGVAAYIEGQEEHHRKFSYGEELTKLLEKHGIPLPAWLSASGG